MSKFEKRLCIVAIVFVAVYMGAVVLTIHSRVSQEDKIERIESPGLAPAEGRLMMVELFLPMLILFTLTICFIIVRKQRAKKLIQLEESDEKLSP